MPYQEGPNKIGSPGLGHWLASVKMRTIGLPCQIVSAWVSSAPHATAVTMSESEAQLRGSSPRRMPSPAPAGQRHGPMQDTRASRQSSRTADWGPAKASRLGSSAVREAFPAPRCRDTKTDEGRRYSTRHVAPIDDKAFWRGSLSFSSVFSCLFFPLTTHKPVSRLILV
ncbi:hypothetical protein TgHK011_008078 [Trichoderma gracile]|nr:hypothetical protein TgHK011_008078 [Trichoderma gracile]